MSEIGDDYTCTMCGNTYTKAQSDADALKECDKNFPGADLSKVSVVCDYCYQKVIDSYPPKVFKAEKALMDHCGVKPEEDHIKALDAAVVHHDFISWLLGILHEQP